MSWKNEPPTSFDNVNYCKIVRDIEHHVILNIIFVMKIVWIDEDSRLSEIEINHKVRNQEYK